MIKINKLLKKKIFIISSIALLLVGSLTLPLWTYLFKLTFIYPSVEKASVQEIKDQVAKLPGVKIETLQAWEGDSMTTLSIKDKGKVFFWYSSGGPVRLDTISPVGQNTIELSFQCEDKTWTGERRPAYSTSLVITKENVPGKLFPFEVTSIKDLVTHYTDIVKVVNTFPRQTESEKIVNQQGTYYLPKNPDPKYSFRLSPHDKAICYYYLPSVQ